MLGMVLPWGAERSMMRRFFPEYFLVAMPMGLIRNLGNGGWSNGPIMKPSSSSLAMRLLTDCGSRAPKHRSRRLVPAWAGWCMENGLDRPGAASTSRRPMEKWR